MFRAPWEGRAFGIAVALSEKGAYPWDDFRASLVKAIEKSSPEYYESWLDALQTLLVQRNIVSPSEVATRAFEYATLQRDPVF